MKKIKVLLASALICSAVVSVGVKPSYADVKSSKDSMESNVQVDGNYGCIWLHGNASTGYQWQFYVEDSSIIDVMEGESDPDDKTGTLCGSGQTDSWIIQGVKPGKTEIAFNYLRPWEKEIIENKIYVVTVDENLNVSITEKFSSSLQTKNGAISLKGNVMTGYGWHYKIQDNNVADIIDKDTVTDNISGQLCDTDQTYTWTVKGLKPGQTEISFDYSKVRTGEVADAKTYVVTVDENLNAVVTEKEVPTVSAETKSDSTAPVVGSNETAVEKDDKKVEDTKETEDNNGTYSVYVEEIKNGEQKKYVINVDKEKVNSYFEKMSSFIDNTIKQERERMNKFFDFFNTNFFM